MKFLKRIKTFLIYSLVLSIVYIPHTSLASWSGSAYSPGETLNPECAPTDSGCTVSLSFTASSGNIGIGSTTPWGKLSVNPNGITGPAFVIGSSTATSFVVDNGGRVGIGTTNPLEELHIVDTTSNAIIYADSYSGGTGSFIGRKAGGTISAPSAVTVSDSLVSIGGRGYGSTGFSASSRGVINIRPSETWTDTAQGTIIAFETTQNNTTSRSQKMVIDGTGHLGIATTSPYAKLSVTGTGVGTTTFALRPIASQTANIVDIYTSAGVLKDVVSSANLWGLGTSSPSSKLSLTQTANTPAGGLWIAETGNTDFRSIYMSDTSGTLSFFGGETAGALNTATLSPAGTWTNASDRPYQENIANLDTKYNLNTLLSIQPRFYTMKGSGKPQIGFIAQELQPILPEVVEGTEGSLGISYGNMVALLVQAIKDINTKVDGLANKFSGVFKTDSVEANKVSTKELCVDDVCVSKEQFREMIVRSGMMPNIIHTNENNNNTGQNSTINTQNIDNGTSTPQVENNATTTQVIENSTTTPQVIENNTNNQNSTTIPQTPDQNLNNNSTENQNTPTE